MGQPAHRTKHLPVLVCPFAASSFSLIQRDDGISNGTALWLSAQCLAFFLARTQQKSIHHHRPRAIELGSGIGFTALALASLGWDVLATDLPHVIESVLRRNITNNLEALPANSGLVQVRQLDWFVHPSSWSWDHESITPPFDLIISADTVYAPELINPFLRTLHALSSLSPVRPPPIFLCVERRDSLLLDRLLSEANENWNFTVERIAHKKLSKCLERSRVQWEKSDWDGVELWKLTLLATLS